jgi:hypothetical protein
MRTKVFTDYRCVSMPLTIYDILASDLCQACLVVEEVSLCLDAFEIRWMIWAIFPLIHFVNRDNIIKLDTKVTIIDMMPNISSSKDI